MSGWWAFPRMSVSSAARTTGSASLGLIGGNYDAQGLLIDAGKLSLEDVLIAEHSAIQSNLDDASNISMRLLERGQLTIDYKEQRICFFPYADMPAYRYGHFGLGFVPEGEHWIIKEIWSGSDAERSGIAKGDTLLQYGRVNMTEEDRCHILFQLPAERDGDSLQVEVRHASPGHEGR